MIPIKSPAGRRKGNPLRVLLADDDPVSGRILDRHLRKWGFDPVQAINGTEAWERLKDKETRLAVLDWEMSTLGDPLADLGLALVYWTEPGDDDILDLAVASEVTPGPGFLTRAQIADRYAVATGRDVSGVGYYMAFGCFKLAVVLEGIHARFLQNKTVGEGFEKEGPAVPLIIQRAHRLLDEGV